MGIAAVRFTALLRELALNVSISDTNYCLLCPARPCINRRPSFGRVYVDLWKVQHCHTAVEGDLVYGRIVNLDSSVLHAAIISDT